MENAIRRYPSALWRLALKTLGSARRTFYWNEQHLGYLAAANDHADLERRLRALGRARPAHFPTFNH